MPDRSYPASLLFGREYFYTVIMKITAFYFADFTYWVIRKKTIYSRRARDISKKTLWFSPKDHINLGKCPKMV